MKGQHETGCWKMTDTARLTASLDRLSAAIESYVAQLEPTKPKLNHAISQTGYIMKTAQANRVTTAAEAKTC